MKQHITAGQVMELPDKSYMKLFNWCKNKIWYDRHYHLQLTIGQMIEFLDEYRKRDWAICFGKDLAFVASIDEITLLGKTPDNRNGELCDGLWKAVKEVLK